MKILVFEYITGGGLNKQALPESLLQEGRLMLQALLDDFRELKVQADYASLSVVVMLDVRHQQHINTQGFEVAIIDANQDCATEFKHNIQPCDAVWPVAPEFDEILATFCAVVEQAKKQLLSSPANVVALTGNKYTSYQLFKQHGIHTVPTRLYQPEIENIELLLNSLLQELNPAASATLSLSDAQWLIKPIAGVGCVDTYVLPSIDSFKHIDSSFGDSIIQPHIDGEKLSLSCLFKAGTAWLLCVNQQHFSLREQQYHLNAITVNVPCEQHCYVQLIADIATAFPDLWGYVGIDLIKTSTQTFVLEINPRLTTSFVGIKAALGINVVQNVLELLAGQPTRNITKQEAMTIKVQDAAIH